MAKKTEEKKGFDEKSLNEVLNMFKEYLEKADKKLSKELEEEKTDEELYEERKEEIITRVNEVANDSKTVIICAGDGGMLMNGSTTEELNVVANIIHAIAEKYRVPREIFEDIIDQVFEGM